MGSGRWLAPRSHAAAGGNAEVFVGEAKVEQRGWSTMSALTLLVPSPTPFTGDKHKSLSAFPTGTCNNTDRDKAYTPACSYLKKMGKNFYPNRKWHFIASAPASFLSWFTEELLFCCIFHAQSLPITTKPRRRKETTELPISSCFHATSPP